MESAYQPPGPDEAYRPHGASDSENANTSQLESTPGGNSWQIFLAMGVTAGVLFGVFWSLWMWMSVWSKRDLVDILTGPGAGRRPVLRDLLRRVLGDPDAPRDHHVSHRP